MGRSINSFSSYVGHAEETIDEERVSLPEKSLWVAVLARAALDAFRGPPHLDMSRKANISHKNHYNYNRDQARHFFLEGGFHFRDICEMAGRNPQYVKEKARKLILRSNGWNVDVPITSHYRQGPKRAKRKYRKKHLTGNAYYASKAKKNFYYQDMGKKGGRPRIYNRIEQ
jgi:Zn-finger nucleic acid-binding protein